MYIWATNQTITGTSLPPPPSLLPFRSGHRSLSLHRCSRGHGPFTSGCRKGIIIRSKPRSSHWSTAQPPLPRPVSSRPPPYIHTDTHARARAHTHARKYLCLYMYGRPLILAIYIRMDCLLRHKPLSSFSCIMKWISVIHEPSWGAWDSSHGHKAQKLQCKSDQQQEDHTTSLREGTARRRNLLSWRINSTPLPL